MRPVRECSENQGENWGNLARGEPQYNIRYFHWLTYVILGAKMRYIYVPSLETGEMNTLIWWCKIFLLCGSHNCLQGPENLSWRRDGVNLISIDCTALSAAWCSLVTLSPLLSSRCQSETQRDPGCCNLFLSNKVGIVPTSPPSRDSESPLHC